MILVDNGSTDNTAKVLAHLQKGPFSPWFRVVSISENKGYGHGLWSGLITTTAPVIGYSHADEQCAPNDVFIAYEKLKNSGKNKILVKGTRLGRAWPNRLVTGVFELIANVCLNLKTNEINAQPKIFSRSLLNELTSPPITFAFDLYLMYHARKSCYSVEDIPVLFPPRAHGVSRWAASFISRWRTILGMIRYMGQVAREEGRLGH